MSNIVNLTRGRVGVLIELMLTKKDLAKFRALIDEVLEEKLEPIRVELGDIKTDTMGLHLKLTQMKADIRNLRSMTSKIKKELDKIINYFDQLWIKTSQEIQRIKEFVNMSF